jgi:hypothetical protein
MKKFTITFLVLAGAFLMLFASCEYDFINPVKLAPPDNGGGGTTTYSFATNIQPIFTKSCAKSTCHVAGAIPPNLVSGSSYSALKNGSYINSTTAAQSKIYTVCASGGVMASYCTPTEAALILAWIQQGAANN